MRTETISELMTRANCTGYPERWDEIYDEAMAEYEQNGCPLTDPAYYDACEQKYGAPSIYKEAFCTAAIEIGKNDALSRLLALLVRALQDREYAFSDLKDFKAPKSPSGEHDIAYDMLTGLASCSLLSYCHGVLTKRGIPEDMVRLVLMYPDSGVSEYRKRCGDANGFHLLEWFQRAIEGRIYRIGRLEIELGTFKGRAVVFRNREGSVQALADDLTLHRSGYALGSKCYEDEEGSFAAEVSETADAFCGYPFRENGSVSDQKISLPKSEWERVIARGDAAICLHIPPSGRLDPVAVDETLEETKAFVDKYFPEFAYRGFFCGSWLLDPQLEEMLGEDSNIVKFGKRFRRFTAKSGGRAVFNFVFKRLDSDFEIDDLPGNTRLERALKEHYRAGKAIYEVNGVFF